MLRNDDPAAFLYLFVMLDLRRMQLLRAVAEHGSFSAAAAALHLTQPAVSRQIAKLEREAGLRLLERSPRGLQLTDAGRVVLERADAIAAHLVAAERELDAVGRVEGGRLRVTAFPTAGATIVVEAIRLFRERHPGVSVSFSELKSTAVAAAIRRGDCDLGLTFRPRGRAAPPDDLLERVHLLTDRMLVALPAGHPCAARPRVRLADLHAEGWIHGSQPGARLIYDACVAAGFEPRIVAETDHAPIVHGLVAAGVGVTLLPGISLPGVRDDVAVRPLAPPEPRREVEAVVRAGRMRPPAVTAMLDVLRELAPRYGVH
jgi:DNA-binding transcriptional LysR family regulator